MSASRTCPNCRGEVPADAPEGVCPFCALRAGFYDGATTLSSDVDDRVLPPDELARRLPEFEHFELIGPGGMGTVYRASQKRLARPVAVKVLHRDLAATPAFTERFEREARTLARLDHPNIVRVHDFGHRDGLYYLVMELVDGVTLRETITAGGVEPDEALAMVPQICAALQYAHDQGVVHRDIKPENILLDKSGALKVADFGLAKLVGVAGEPRLTATAQVMGTPHYMAPEQIEKPDTVDHRADIFALGVVFYELLTGELPVGRFPVPSEKVRVDVTLDKVVLRTLEKEPGMRYQRASELGDEVEALSGGGSAQSFLRGDWGWAGYGRRHAAWGHPDYRGRPFEYRSEQTLFGLPLVHVTFARDPGGAQMKLARGILAIGDAAIGLIAIGGMCAGGIAIGGMSVGLLTIGGLTMGLLVALGRHRRRRASRPVAVLSASSRPEASPAASGRSRAKRRGASASVPGSWPRWPSLPRRSGERTSCDEPASDANPPEKTLRVRGSASPRDLQSAGHQPPRLRLRARLPNARGARPSRGTIADRPTAGAPTVRGRRRARPGSTSARRCRPGRRTA